MSDDRERLARVVLSRAAEPGDAKLCRAVHDLGASTVLGAILDQREEDLGRADLAERLDSVDPARELEVAERLGIRFLIPGDDEWPTRLTDLARGQEVQLRGGVPLGLWTRGPLRLSDLPPSVAVVGSRSATTYGAGVAADIAAVLTRAGMPVVSGAAFGIDQAGHRGCLAAGGPTVAVLACGPERAYPAAHRPLIDHIGEQGLVVSEVPPGCAPTRIRFLSRNRLIAALTVGTVIVEAAVRSGALNTANWAGKLNRVLMGVPGPVSSAPSQGVHQLIREGAATLVTSGRDVLELVGAAGEHLVEPPRAPARRRDRLSQRDQRVLDSVPVATHVGADSIARSAGIAILEVSSALTRLEQAGLVTGERGLWRLAAPTGDEVTG